MSDALFPARLTPFSRSLERTMGAGTDMNGHRTVIRSTPEGEAMLRTRGGHPEFSLKKRAQRVRPSCIRAPLIEVDYARRTYYAETTLFSTCGMFKIQVAYLKSIEFRDADANTVIFVFSSPVGNASMPSVVPDNAIVFVERAHSTRTYHRSKLVGPEHYPAIDRLQDRLYFKWNGVVFEQKPIHTMTFLINDVLTVTYSFDEDPQASSDEAYTNYIVAVSDDHACMARDLAEVNDMRRGDPEAPVAMFIMAYPDGGKHGKVYLEGLGGFMQMVSSEFCDGLKMGMPLSLSDIGIFGHCHHGLLRFPPASTPELIRHDGSVAPFPDQAFSITQTQALFGNCFESRSPLGLPEVQREGIYRQEDVTARRQWLNYGLFSGSTTGSLSGYRQSYFGDGASWVYFDEAGDCCDIEFYGTVENANNSGYVGGYAAAKIILPHAMTYDGETHPDNFTVIDLPDSDCRVFGEVGRTVLMARTKDGRRSIHASHMRVPDGGHTYFEGLSPYADYPCDFYELLVSGQIDRDAPNSGLTFSWRRMSELPAATEEESRDYSANEVRGVSVGTVHINAWPHSIVNATGAYNRRSRSTTTVRRRLGCYFVGDELRWIEGVSVRSSTTDRVEQFSEGIDFAPGESTTTSRQTASVELLFDGVVATSWSTESTSTTSASTALFLGDVLEAQDAHETETEEKYTPAHVAAGLNFVLSEATFVVMYTPNVFGLARVNDAADNVIFLDVCSPTESVFKETAGVGVIDGMGTQLGGVSLNPSDNMLYATWNPVTGELHTDNVPCTWI